MIYSAPTPITAHQEGVTGRTHGVAVETIGKTQPYTRDVIRLRNRSTQSSPTYSCLPQYHYYSYVPQYQVQPTQTAMLAPTMSITMEK